MKLKDISFSTMSFDSGTKIGEGTVINCTPIEFQTPKIIIDHIKDNVLYARLKPTEACKTFYTFIKDFETFLTQKYTHTESIFDGSVFRIKVPIKSTRIYHNGSLFNWYHLTPGMEIIVLVSISTIWKNINMYYTINSKEIMLLKKMEE
jgi:hypothetical protein